MREMEEILCHPDLTPAPGRIIVLDGVRYRVLRQPTAQQNISSGPSAKWMNVVVVERQNDGLGRILTFLRN